MSDPLTILRALPAIRAEAERLAREVYEAQSGTFYAHGMGPSLLWDLLPERMCAAYVGAHLTLLTDLTRPTSRDAVARMVAERLGLVCGATAPLLSCIKGVDPGTIWSLSVRSDTDMSKSPSVTIDQHVFVEPNVFPGSPLAMVVPGISVIADPAEALRIIALHVLGATHV